VARLFAGEKGSAIAFQGSIWECDLCLLPGKGAFSQVRATIFLFGFCIKLPSVGAYLQ
jgi:hypothetical protein